MKKETLVNMQNRQNKIYEVVKQVRQLVDELLEPLDVFERKAVEEEVKSLVFDE